MDCLLGGSVFVTGRKSPGTQQRLRSQGPVSPLPLWRQPPGCQLWGQHPDPPCRRQLAPLGEPCAPASWKACQGQPHCGDLPGASTEQAPNKSSSPGTERLEHPSAPGPDTGRGQARFRKGKREDRPALGAPVRAGQPGTRGRNRRGPLPSWRGGPRRERVLVPSASPAGEQNRTCSGSRDGAEGTLSFPNRFVLLKTLHG